MAIFPPSELTPELATLFQMQARLDAIVTGLDVVAAALTNLTVPPAVVEVFPTIDSTSPAPVVDFAPVIAAINALGARIDRVEQAVIAPRVRDVQRGPDGRITATTERTLRD